MLTFSEMPRYRVLEPIGLNGRLELPGREIEFTGWPIPGISHALEPLNESAKAVMRYYKANRTNEVLPLAPVHHGKVTLPAFAIPRWKATRRGLFVTQSPFSNFRLQETVVCEGHGFSTVGWPDWKPDAALPASAEAEQILAFMRDNPDVPRAPVAWDVPNATIMTPERWAELSASAPAIPQTLSPRGSAHRTSPVNTLRPYNPFAA